MIAGTLVTLYPGLAIGPLLNLLGFGKIGIVAQVCKNDFL